MRAEEVKTAYFLSVVGRRLFAGLAWLSLLALLPTTGLLAQRSIDPNYPQSQMPGAMTPMGGNPMSAEMEAKRLGAMNAERQKSLVADTNRLLKLTADLNAQINSEHPASLTEAQLRMVAEIEKLARNIREKMSMPVNGNPQFGPSPAPMMIPPSPMR